MTTYYLIRSGEDFAVETRNEMVIAVCGPIDAADYPREGSAIDLRDWNYEDSDDDTSVNPWGAGVAIMAYQDADDSHATWID